MAYISTPPWKIIAATARKDTISSSISSYFLFFSTIHNPKRCRLITFSIDPSSSSCSTSGSTSSVKHHLVADNKKTLKIVKSFNGSFSDDESIVVFDKDDDIISKKNKKKSFWKKILFSSDKIRSIMLLHVVTIVYASNISVVKVVEGMMDPAAFSAMRFVMSAIPFLPFVIKARDDVETRNAGIELGFWVSLGYLIEALALLTSDAGRASFISIFTVIVVPLLDGMLGAIVPARTWFGVLMSVVGVAMLEGSGSPPNVGDLLNFLSAIFFGIHMLRTEHFSRTTTKDNLLPLLGYEVCVVAVLSTIWVMIGGLFDGIEENNPLTWRVIWDWIVAFPWISALYTGAFSTGLCLWVEIAAMRDVSATETAIIYGLEPVWGAGFAWFLLGERWGMAGWVGAALVLGGSLIVQIPSESIKTRVHKKKDDIQKLHTNLKASPVVIRSSKNILK